jgi:hypothetical protein
MIENIGRKYGSKYMIENRYNGGNVVVAFSVVECVVRESVEVVEFCG